MKYLWQVSDFNIDIRFKWNNISETSNMSLLTSDSFCLIMSHLEKKKDTQSENNEALYNRYIITLFNWFRWYSIFKLYGLYK